MRAQDSPDTISSKNCTPPEDTRLNTQRNATSLFGTIARTLSGIFSTVSTEPDMTENEYIFMKKPQENCRDIETTQSKSKTNVKNSPNLLNSNSNPNTAGIQNQPLIKSAVKNIENKQINFKPNLQPKLSRSHYHDIPIPNTQSLIQSEKKNSQDFTKPAFPKNRQTNSQTKIKDQRMDTSSDNTDTSHKSHNIKSQSVCSMKFKSFPENSYQFKPLNSLATSSSKNIKIIPENNESDTADQKNIFDSSKNLFCKASNNNNISNIEFNAQTAQIPSKTIKENNREYENKRTALIDLNQQTNYLNKSHENLDLKNERLTNIFPSQSLEINQQKINKPENIVENISQTDIPININSPKIIKSPYIETKNLETQDERVKARYESFKKHYESSKITPIIPARNQSKEKIERYRMSKIMVFENTADVEIIQANSSKIGKQGYQKMEIDIMPIKIKPKSALETLPEINILESPKKSQILANKPDQQTNAENGGKLFYLYTNGKSKHLTNLNRTNETDKVTKSKKINKYRINNYTNHLVLMRYLNESNIERLVRLLNKYNHPPTFEIQPMKRGINKVNLVCKNRKMYEKFNSITKAWINYVVKCEYLEKIRPLPQKSTDINNNTPKNLKGNSMENLFDKKTGMYLNKTLNLRDWKLYYCKPDGNCLFRALAFLLLGNQENHLIIRAMVVEHILKHKNYYANFIDEEFDTYIMKLSKDKSWGDAIAIQAISEICERKIELYSLQNKSNILRLKRSFYEEIPGSQDSLKLLYSPGHYDAIIKKYVYISEQTIERKSVLDKAKDNEAYPNYCL